MSAPIDTPPPVAPSDGWVARTPAPISLPATSPPQLKEQRPGRAGQAGRQSRRRQRRQQGHLLASGCGVRHATALRTQTGLLFDLPTYRPRRPPPPRPPPLPPTQPVTRPRRRPPSACPPRAPRCAQHRGPQHLAHTRARTPRAAARRTALERACEPPWLPPLARQMPPHLPGRELCGLRGEFVARAIRQSGTARRAGCAHSLPCRACCAGWAPSTARRARTRRCGRSEGVGWDGEWYGGFGTGNETGAGRAEREVGAALERLQTWTTSGRCM